MMTSGSILDRDHDISKSQSRWRIRVSLRNVRQIIEKTVDSLNATILNIPNVNAICAEGILFTLSMFD